MIGETPVGLRMNTYIAGGEVWGPRVRGRVLPVGADWLTIRPDGIGMLDVRGTIETHDGALLYVDCDTRWLHLPDALFARLRGEGGGAPVCCMHVPEGAFSEQFFADYHRFVQHKQPQLQAPHSINRAE